MFLYIANITHQRHVVNYRLDFVQEGNAALRANNTKQVILLPGEQKTIGGDLTQTQAQMIMDQLTPEGVGVEEINRLPLVKVAYVLSFGKAIPTKILHLVNEHNKNLLTKEGDIRRRQAAIAAHPLVDQQIDNLKRLDIEMIEVPPEPGEPESVGRPLDFGVHLDPSAKEADGRPAPRKQSRAERRAQKRI